MACSQATQEALWLRHLEGDLGYGDNSIAQFGKWCSQDFIAKKLSTHADPDETPSTIFNDNKGAIAMTYNPVHSRRGRHIHIRYLFCRQQTEEGHVEFAFIPGTENWADLFTKGLPKKTHDYLAGKLVYCSIDDQLCNYKGQPVSGKARPIVKENIQIPILNKYYPRIAMDISDYDEGEEIYRILKERRKDEDQLLKRSLNNNKHTKVAGCVIQELIMELQNYCNTV